MKPLLVLIIVVSLWVMWRALVDSLDDTTMGGYYD